MVIRKSSVENRQSSSGVPSEQLFVSQALKGRQRRDGSIVELTDDKSSAGRYLPDSNDVNAGT